MLHDTLSKMSDDELIRALITVSGPLIKELGRRGYDMSLAAPHEKAGDGVAVESLYDIHLSISVERPTPP